MRARVGFQEMKDVFGFSLRAFARAGLLPTAKRSPEKSRGLGAQLRGLHMPLCSKPVATLRMSQKMQHVPSAPFGGESTGQGMEDAAEHESSPEHQLLMLQRLRHSQLEHALIRHKAQRFMALKAFHRSLELRRQLSRARQAALSPTAAVGANLAPPTALDPSVKALIDKLTELAEIFPSGSNVTQSSAEQPFQRPFQRGGQQTEQQNSITGKVSLATTTTVQTAPQGLPSGGANDESWDEGDTTDHLDAAVHQAEGSDRSKGERMGAAAGSSRDPAVGENFLDPSGNEDVLGQQLRELGSDMNTMFQDLEKEPKGGSKDSDLAGKTNPQQENLSEEEKRGKQRQEEERQKERAALLVQLEGLSGGTNIRRPKWRWIADGVDDPHPDRVLKGKHLWKAMALLIIVFFVRPRRTLMQRKARSKDRETQDWTATLTIYFDRCQTWLLKTARVPVGNSVLKSSTLNFRLNRVDGKRDAYGAAAPGAVNAGGGFVSTLVRKVARGISHESLALTLMRLKVHAKGVLNGLTQEMPPADIMTFLSYLAADGNYFPDGFFFVEETKVLAFDDLGAVRNLTPITDPPESLDDTLYALHRSKELEKELEADKQGHHDGFLDSHHLGWLADAGHILLESTKAGKAGNAAALAARSTDLRTAILHGRHRIPGKFKAVYRHESSSQWFDTSYVEMILTNYLMVRVLIPWILLYPKESGLVPSSGVKPSLLTHNCQVLASTVYLIVRVLRPELTPPNADTLKAALAEETERATRIAAAAGDDDGGGGEDFREDNKSEEDSNHGKSEDAGAALGDRKKNGPASEEGTAEDQKAVDADGSTGKRGGTRKKLAGLRRGSRAAPSTAPIKLRTVPQIMQQKRYVSISDRQLVSGLLPDAYFLPFAEQMRPWVLQLAAEFDSWMQKVVAVVVGKVEGSAIRHERPPPTKST